ncbi:MAG: Smr/MutS family protein [Gemmatimonadales bacterium]
MLLPSSRPEATFDLHGQRVLDAVIDAERFLRAQQKAGRRVVRLITGRGKGGGGAPVRTRVRTLLKRLTGEVVVEFELEDSEGSFLVELRG